jgi:hypothetical protein
LNQKKISSSGAAKRVDNALGRRCLIRLHVSARYPSAGGQRGQLARHPRKASSRPDCELSSLSTGAARFAALREAPIESSLDNIIE